MSARSRWILLGSLGCALCATGEARAQDADADGTPDHADTFPCDATRASVTYFPSASESALLTYEDQWPGPTDLDFNDVAVRVHFRAERNSAGNVVRLVGVFDPVALGGELSNGLGLVLPVGKTGVEAQRRVGGGAWTALTPEADANVTLVLSSNLRELYGSASGRINSRTNEGRLTGQRLELEINFSTPAALSQGAAPWDVFVFRAGWVSGATRHEIHLPSYAGTGSMAPNLLNTQQDASNASRRFVYQSGVPAALNLLTSTRYPVEGLAISALFPEIAGFAGSGGTQNTLFYAAANVVAANGHDIAAAAVPAMSAPSASCVRPFHSFSFTTAASYINTPSLQGDVMVLRTDNPPVGFSYVTGVGQMPMPAAPRTGYLQFGVAACSPNGAVLGLGIQDGWGNTNSLAQLVGPFPSTWTWYTTVPVNETESRSINYMYIPDPRPRELRVRYMVIGHPDDVASFRAFNPVSGPCN
jgi:LruC domain-containing protein